MTDEAELEYPVPAPLSVKEREWFFDRFDDVLSATETGTRNPAVVAAVCQIAGNRRWTDWINMQPRSRLGATSLEGIELECIARYLAWLATGNREGAQHLRPLLGSMFSVGIEMPAIEGVEHARQRLSKHVEQLRNLCQTTERPNVNSHEIPCIGEKRLKCILRNHLLLKWYEEEEQTYQKLADKWTELSTLAYSKDGVKQAIQRAKDDRKINIRPGNPVKITSGKEAGAVKPLETLDSFQSELERQKHKRSTRR